MKLQIELIGDIIHVYIPGTGPNGHGHPIKLPATLHGCGQLLTILNEQQKPGPKTIGYAASPTSFDAKFVEDYLKQKKYIDLEEVEWT